jgi:hypothetical protein
MACPLHYTKCVTLKIEKTLGERCTIIKLMGRIRAEHLDELKAQISASVPWIVLELGEVSLVDADAVRFLSACEPEGIHLQHCSAYISNIAQPSYASGLSGNRKASSKVKTSASDATWKIITSLHFELRLAA